MLIDGRFIVPAPPEQVLVHLFDAQLMASCLPGCESLEAIDADRYRAVVAIALAGVKARFDLQVEITSREADGIHAITRGEEGGNASSLQATSDVRLAAVPEGTCVDYRSEVAVTGRLGRFALGMMKKKAQSVGDEFAANLQARLTTEAPVRPAEPSAAEVVPIELPVLAEPAAAGADLSPIPALAAASTSPASPGQRLWSWLRGLFASSRSAGRRNP